MDQVEAWKAECLRLKAENEHLRQECLRNRRQELMEHLLRGEFTTGADIAGDLRAVSIYLTRDSFLELYVNVLEPPPATAEKDLAAPDFRAVYEDGIGALIEQFYPEYYVGSLRFGTGVAAILQMDPAGERAVPPPAKGNFIDTLNTRGLQLVDKLHELHGLDAFVAISRPHSGVEGISEAHQEILEINNYRAIMGIDVPLLCYHDFEMAEVDSAGGSQLDLEQKYLCCVELGEYERARQLLKSMIDQEFRQAVPSLFSLRYRLSAKLGLLLITLEKFQTQEQPAIFDEVLALQKALTQDDLTLEEFREKIDLIFDHIAAFLAQQRTPKWLSPLLRYVDEHCTCSELNVASICDTFGLSPSYLTREVKRCTGSGLLDLLQKKRLDRAAQLIGSGAGLAQAAEQSGFGDTRSMRRAFQKYIHTTPQKYLEDHPAT